MQTVDSETRTSLAPTGSLRVAVAVGTAISAVWTARSAETGRPVGPTVDLAEILAERIGVPLTLVELGSSGEIIEKVDTGIWDVSFTPVDAERRKAASFGPNHFLGSSTYMVPAGSTLKHVDDVDQDGMRVYGVENTATIRSARKSLGKTSVTGAANLDDAVAKFQAGEVDALAIGKESIESLLPQFPGSRILDGHYHAAGTAVVVPHGREKALEVFSAIMEELKADGTVQRIFAKHGMPSATVAPAGSGA
jgi:polar amino acid transport system substrate-binding protein